MKYLLTVFMFLISCADIDTVPKLENYRDKVHQNKTHIGSTCSTGCIWSSYAVYNNLQSASKQCEEGPCACVELGNANISCENQTEITVSSNINQNIIVEDNSIPELPYYNQYYNEKFGWATCQNTSVAMVLSHFENTIHPDSIYKEWGKDFAQSPSGLNAVYNSYASKSNIATYTNASPEELKSALKSGYIAIVHGYFTSVGHVIVVRGYQNGFYYVNDPAGNWDECFKCGYNRRNDLDGVTLYSESAFEAAVFTSDGFSYLPGWIHLISPL